MKNVGIVPIQGSKIGAIRKFGRNEDIDAQEYLNTLGLVPKQFAVGAASDMYISSSHAGDTSVNITIEYLDDDGLEQIVTKALNAADSTDFVDVGVDAIFVNKAYVTSANVTLNGDVYVSSDNTDAGGNGIPDTLADTFIVIPLGDGQSVSACFLVPSNKSAEVYGWGASIVHDGGATTTVTFRLKQLPSGGSWRTVESDGAISDGTTKVGDIWPFSERYPALTLLAIEAQEVGAANNDCTGKIFLALTED